MVPAVQGIRAVQFPLMVQAVQKVRLDQPVQVGRWVPKDQAIQVVRLAPADLKIPKLREILAFRFRPADPAILDSLEVRVARMVLQVLVDPLDQAVQKRLVDQKDRGRPEDLDCQADPTVPVVRLVQAAHSDQLALLDPLDRLSQENQRAPEDPNFLVVPRILDLRWGPEVPKARLVLMDRAVPEDPETQRVQVVPVVR